MKKIAIALFVIICVINTITLADGYFVLCNPDSGVFVRNKPQKTASEVGWVEFGRFVKTDGKEKNGFVHVIDLAAEETEGWVSKGYLVDDEPVIKKCRLSNDTGWNVICRKCVDGKKIGVLRNRKSVTVYAMSDEWAVTNKGYIKREFLTEVEDE